MSLVTKARENFEVAQRAFDDGHYNAAASRVYYALRQACIGELKSRGKTVAVYDQKLAMSLKEQNRDDEWPHSLFTRQCIKDTVLSLNEQQQDKIIQAFAMRIKGDYNELEDVKQHEIEDIIMLAAPEILKGLGVAI